MATIILTSHHLPGHTRAGAAGCSQRPEIQPVGSFGHRALTLVRNPTIRLDTWHAEEYHRHTYAFLTRRRLRSFSASRGNHPAFAVGRQVFPQEGMEENHARSRG